MTSGLGLLEQAISPGGEGEGHPGRAQAQRCGGAIHGREDALTEATGPQGSEKH